MFAYCVNSVGEILKELGSRDAKFKDKMALLNEYMEQRDLEAGVQVRVRKYFEYLHSEGM